MTKLFYPSLNRTLKIGVFCSGILAITAWSSDPKPKNDNPRVIEFNVASIDGVTHWTPAKVTVKPGEKVKLVLKHEIAGGYDFHGFKLDLLGIEKKVDRKNTMEITAHVPADAKKGEYPVKCQFHPKHVAATLVVE